MSIVIDSRLKRKIENISEMEGEMCCVKFTDLEDVFWFENTNELQEFLNKQSVERYYDKSLRKGYFYYTNENNDTFRYYVKCNRGNLELLNEEFVVD